MSNFSLVVLISGNGSNLQAIIDQIGCGYLNASISCVISNKPNAFGLERAAQHNIAHHVLDHTQFDSREAYDAELIKLIKPYQPNCIVLAGFMRILSADFFHQFTHKIINIHPSLLPKYQGLHTHKRALENQDTQHGISVHMATEKLDSGPVIAQAHFDIMENDSVETLQKKCHHLEHILYPLVLRFMADQHINIQTGQVLYQQKPLPKPIKLHQVAEHDLPQSH